LDLGADQRKVKKAELGIISLLSRNHESETSRTMRMRGANPRTRTRNRKKSKSNPIFPPEPLFPIIYRRKNSKKRKGEIVIVTGHGSPYWLGPRSSGPKHFASIKLFIAIL
jgi:hypothetical protein